MEATALRKLNCQICGHVGLLCSGLPNGGTYGRSNRLNALKGCQTRLGTSVTASQLAFLFPYAPPRNRAQKLRSFASIQGGKRAGRISSRLRQEPQFRDLRFSRQRLSRTRRYGRLKDWEKPWRLSASLWERENPNPIRHAYVTVLAFPFSLTLS